MDNSKTERKRLTYAEKFQILDMLARGISNDEIVSTFGVSHRFLRKLKGEGPELRKRFDLRTTLRKRKSGHVAKYLEIDAAVMEYVFRCRELKFPISRDAVNRTEIEQRVSTV